MNPFTILPIETPSLGDRSYLVHDGSVAVVIDPQRDLDRMLALLEEHRLRLACVLETHLHNDYVSGGRALARRTGATYHVSAAEEVAFEREPVEDGQLIAAGDGIRLTALATPGHTFHHLSYALHESGRGLGDATALFSGGSLLYGSTGRPDLLGPEHTEVLARQQRASAHRLAALLPPEAALHPTHGFGSFCASSQSADKDSSTIGEERRTNPVLTQDEEHWLRDLLAGLDVWPAYYTHVGPRNASGADEADLDPVARADASEVRRRIEAGEWVVDLRDRKAFAAGHAPGSYNAGLDGDFVTYVGWLIPWGTPITLLGESPNQVAEAQRQLARIGIDRPAAQCSGRPEDWTDGSLASFPTATFGDLAKAQGNRPVTVLDVRLGKEFAESHLARALSIPLPELPGRVGEVPDGEVWVHCTSGYRASVAASLLDAAGRRVVAVDDEFANATDVGLRVVGSR